MVKTLTRQAISFCCHIQSVVPFDHSKILSETIPVEKQISGPQR